MKPAIAVREATERDATAIADLWTEAYVTLGVGGRTEPYEETDFAHSTRHGHAFVVDGPSGVTGIVVLSAPGSAGRAVATGAEAELSRLAVALPSRRAGIGRALVAHCERRARDESWVAIALWSRPGQTEAHRLYESLGYRRATDRDTTDVTGHERLVFTLDLDPDERIAP